MARPVFTDAQRRFLHIRGALYVVRYAVIAGVLIGLAAFGVLHS